MRLGASLAKLEEKAARVVRCAWCRYSLVDDHQQRARGRRVTTDFVMRSCPFCGNEFKVGLEGMSAKERETFVLWAYTYQGETYRDERVYAAQEWWEARQWVRIITEPEQFRAAVEARKRQQCGQGKPDRYAQERAELKAEADRLRNAEVRRQRREYGPRTFPLVALLRPLKAELKGLKLPRYLPGSGFPSKAEKEAQEVLAYARIMEACELVLWGSVEPETAALIEARAAEVAAFVERREREAREKEEERQRQEREREARLRQGSTPRREPPTPVRVPEPPRSRFRKDPTAPVPRSPMVFDPTAAQSPNPLS